MTPEAALPDVGQRLAAARLQRGLAQTDVAERAGLAPSYVSRIENGKVQPTLPTLMKLVRVLGADLSEIVGPEPRPATRQGPCPVTARGTCLLDLIADPADREHYSPREVKLLRRFARWLKTVEPDRKRAMEILVEDLLRSAERPDG